MAQPLVRAWRWPQGGFTARASYGWSVALPRPGDSRGAAGVGCRDRRGVAGVRGAGAGSACALRPGRAPCTRGCAHPEGVLDCRRTRVGGIRSSGAERPRCPGARRAPLAGDGARPERSGDPDGAGIGGIRARRARRSCGAGLRVARLPRCGAGGKRLCDGLIAPRQRCAGGRRRPRQAGAWIRSGGRCCGRGGGRGSRGGRRSGRSRHDRSRCTRRCGGACRVGGRHREGVAGAVGKAGDGAGG